MDDKKLAAAVAAVYTVIRTGEQAAAAAMLQTPGPAEHNLVQPQVQIAAPCPNIWAVSGRQAQMQAGAMMQLRMFK
jgi:hypothetical protein